MRHHPLLWKLAALQVGFCLLLTWLIWTWGLSVERSTYFLEPADRLYLARYAQQAESTWRSEGAEGVERFRQRLEAEENTWVAVIGDHLQSLGTTPLDAEESSHLTFMRKLDWPMSRRLQDELPFVSIEFPEHPEQGRLVMQLPERLLPSGLTPWTHVITHGVAPTLLALLLGLVLYRHLVLPLNRLRDRANALRADDLDEDGLGTPLTERRDELGELAQAFEHMAERLRQSLVQQRLLLRTLSHELRTPLARLRIAHDSDLSGEQLRQRLSREIDDMQRLLEDTLDLAWMDTERPRLNTEPVLLLSVWEALREDACFESGWAPERLPCFVGTECCVQAHLDSLAQALENLMRNAIRHSPPGGRISLEGWREGEHWHLVLRDQGPGVDEADLERIFQPYQRLASSAGHGFGLGLAIARRAIELQQGQLWASNGEPGLCMHLLLPATSPTVERPQAAAALAGVNLPQSATG
ncbi:MAG: Sensor protein PfeS [Stenotrophomonas maltophilia]|nr:MAG: Sensor protein PfeS [Stenotrophomonas maltophilia]